MNPRDELRALRVAVRLLMGPALLAIAAVLAGLYTVAASHPPDMEPAAIEARLDSLESAVFDSVEHVDSMGR